MRLEDIRLLNESPQDDMEHRRRAANAYTDLIRKFEMMGGLFAMRPKGDFLVATKGMLRHIEDISLVIVPDGHPDFRGVDGGINKDSRALWLVLDLDEDIMPQLHKSKMRTTIVHEFTHLIDSERMGVMRPTRSLSNDDYYNDASEVNAYYQEAVDAFEDRMSILRTKPVAWERISPRMKNDFGEFLSFLKYLMSEDFERNMNEDTKRKVVRRLYRYWDEVVRYM